VAITFDYDETHEAFRFSLDGEARPLIPRLEGSEVKDWIANYTRVYTWLAQEQPRMRESFDELMRVEHTTEEGLLDALLAYDQSGALGDREWLVENLTVEQLILMLQRIARVHA